MQTPMDPLIRVYTEIVITAEIVGYQKQQQTTLERATK